MVFLNVRVGRENCGVKITVSFLFSIIVHLMRMYTIGQWFAIIFFSLMECWVVIGLSSNDANDLCVKPM